MYQNYVGQSWKHVCHGAYDHYHYMETRHKCAVAEQRSEKTEENKHGPVIAGYSAEGETLYWD